MGDGVVRETSHPIMCLIISLNDLTLQSEDDVSVTLEKDTICRHERLSFMSPVILFHTKTCSTPAAVNYVELPQQAISLLVTLLICNKSS